ncbi:unnamed protein product [Rhizoctonia solani]|uniref:GPI-anchor transamidase n=1 Tax=Rhizoctonia solani TaxID=456999 RepID=A0A8H3BPK1_9AGAM|nr:unnamed protein product [Rhizoctonia solani]
MISFTSILLAATVVKATARREVAVHKHNSAVTCGQFPTAPLQWKSCFSVYDRHIFARCFEVNQVAHINCRLNVLIYVMSTAAVVFAVGFVLSLLSRGQASPRAGHTHLNVRRRGRYNNIIASSEPVRDGLMPSDPPQVGTNHASATERGRKRSVEAYTSGSPSNTTLSRQDTVVDLTPATQAPPPTLDDIRLDSTKLWDHFLAYFGERYIGIRIPDELSLSNFSPRQYIFRVINTRLLRSLYGWRPPLFILVIAVHDAVHDHDFLELALEPWKSGGVHFAGLINEVTLNSINTAIRRLYDKSMRVPGSEVFILLTGHGNGANRMILSTNELISETTLFSLLRAVQKGYPRLVPVTVLFDICRPGFIFNSPAPRGVSSVWSCFPGEKAGACRFPGFNAPDSCFLIALIMAARTLDFEYTSQAGKINMDGLLELVRVLSGTEIAEQVYQRFIGNDHFRTLNNLSSPKRSRSVHQADEEPQSGVLSAAVATSSPALGFSPLPSNTSNHERGANLPVHVR